MKNLLISTALFASIALTHHASQAAPPLTGCHTKAGTAGVFAPKSTVLVYLYTGSDGVGENIQTATSLGIQDLEFATRRALSVWNEESGAAIKLSYAGQTSSSATPAAGIVLRGARTDECTNHQCYCASNNSDFDDDEEYVYYNARAQSAGSGSGGVRQKGYVRYFRQYDSHLNHCVRIDWKFDEVNNDLDYTRVLIHELGHVVFDIGHPYDTVNYTCDPVASSAPSVMNPGPKNRPYNLQDLDVEYAQERYGQHRGIFSSIKYAFPNGPTSWQNAPAGALGAHPIYRPGSLPVSYPYSNVGWVDQPTSLPRIGGSGISTAGRYEGGYAYSLDYDAMMRPVATAGKPGTGEVILAFQKRTAAYFASGGDIGKICFRRSLDYGMTYSSEICYAGSYANRNGLSAAYDAYSNRFLIGYTGETPYVTTSVARKVSILTVPSVTGGTSAFQHYESSVESLHAPSIACTGALGGCKVFFQPVAILGCATWGSLNVPSGSGAVTFGAVTSGSTCIPVFDTPAVAYNPAAGKYRLAMTSVGNAIYSYELNSSATSLVGTGDVFNQAGTFVSTPAMGVSTLNIGASQPQVWFIKYW